MRGLMRGLLGVVGLVFLFSGPARAQLTPKVEVSAGFDFTSYYTASGAPRLSMKGWEGTGVYNFRRWIGVAGNVSGVYNTQKSSNPQINNTKLTVYTYMGGPRIYPLGHHRATLFGQVLIGEGHVIQNLPAVPPFPAGTLKDSGFAYSFGPGIDISIGDHWAVGGSFDYLHTRFFSSTAGQGNYRLIGALTYRFGETRDTRRKKPR